MSAARLERIEQKVDKLSEIVAELARIDERVTAQDHRIERHTVRLDLLEEKLGEILETVTGNNHKAQMLERAFWVVFASAVALAVKFF